MAVVEGEITQNRTVSKNSSVLKTILQWLIIHCLQRAYVRELIVAEYLILQILLIHFLQRAYGRVTGRLVLNTYHNKYIQPK